VRWIQDDREFAAVLNRAHQLTTGGPKAEAQMSVLVFDDVVLLTPSFFSLLVLLMKCSSDRAVSYVVIQPDPVSYFHKFFGKYSALEISDGDSAEEYLTILNEDPGDSPADAVGINFGVAVIVPDSGSWFAQVSHSADDDGGQLWVPLAWVAEIIFAHPYLHVKETQLVS